MALLYIVLILTVLLSGSLVFLLKIGEQRYMKLMLAFSGAFLIGVTFLVLVPEVYEEATMYTGLFVLAGFLLQLIMELITEGAEHGHAHVHRENERVSPFLLLLGLCIHAFLEGMPIIDELDPHLRSSLVWGIVIHNIPISITLTGLFLHYGCSRLKAFIYLLVFALMTPLGSLFSYLLDHSMAVSIGQYHRYILAVVIGIFLHVSTSILFETGENHRYNLKKILTVCAGLLVAYLISGNHHHTHFH